MPLAPTRSLSFFFFFNDTATTEIYTLSLHDALPILVVGLPTGRMRHFSISTPLGSALGKLKMTCGWKSRPANAVAGRPGPSLAGGVVTHRLKRRQGSCGVRADSPERVKVVEAEAVPV